MKDGMAFNKILFTAVSFCLVASMSARAQEYIDVAPDNDEILAVEDTQPVVLSQPVGVTRGMQPRMAPQAQAQAQAQAQTQVTTNVQTALPRRDNRVAVIDPRSGEMAVASPSTGIGGSNPGNANTGGVQIVSVQANPNNSNDIASNNRSDILRRERMRSELNNETRLIERLEEGRMSDEARRMKAIENYKSAVGADQDVVSANTATTTAIADNGSVANATTTIVAPVLAVNENEKHGAGVKSSYGYYDGLFGLGGAFKLVPFAGYKWYSTNSILDATNRFTTGVGMEGRLNDFMALEGAFAYSQDEFRNNGFAGIGGYGSYSHFGSTSAACCAGPEYFQRTRKNYEVSGGAKIGYQMGRFRPFGAAGIVGIFRSYNIDAAVTKEILSANGLQRSTTHVGGNFGMGFDVAAAKNIAVGARWDYQAILNQKNNDMQRIYGDSSNSYRVTGNVQLVF